MKLISFVSLKGGAGKTTALSALCSALLARGRKVALLEGDENAPISQWRRYARDAGRWDEACQIHFAADLDSFEKAVVEAERQGVEFMLADTHGGGSEINSIVVANSALVIVPTAITTYDIDEAVNTMEFVHDQIEEEGTGTLMALLVTKLPHTPNKSRQIEIDRLDVFPMLATRLRDRDAYASMKRDGMLHLTVRAKEADPASRISAKHFKLAMAEADELATDVLVALED